MTVVTDGLSLPVTMATDTPVIVLGQTCHRIPPWVAVMRAARNRWRNKTAEEIAHRTGRSVRSVRRWMRGETVPGIDVGFDMIRSDVGTTIIVMIARDLPADRRVKFFEDLAAVARREALQARLDALNE